MAQNNQKNILSEEKKILSEEKEVLEELKEEEKEIKKTGRNQLLISILLALIIAGIVIGAVYWKVSSGQIYTDAAIISAEQILLSPKTKGVLEEVYVNPGDLISENAPIARVGNELIKSTISGTVISVNSDIGALFNPGQTVATMIDQTTLHVVASIDEDKGLSSISVGQSAAFTVDAFGSKKYYGVVDEISPTSKQSDIVFNISGKREIQSFDVKIRFDTNLYPELKNGMSAKIWIYR